MFLWYVAKTMILPGIQSLYPTIRACSKQFSSNLRVIPWASGFECYRALSMQHHPESINLQCFHDPPTKLLGVRYHNDRPVRSRPPRRLEVIAQGRCHLARKLPGARGRTNPFVRSRLHRDRLVASLSLETSFVSPRTVLCEV
jgi:hypothetical protein